LNARKIVAGRGTDERHLNTSHNSRINSNTFFLGTRLPSMWSITDLDHDVEPAKVTFISGLKDQYPCLFASAVLERDSIPDEKVRSLRLNLMNQTNEDI
jgi:hypothetical protein